MELTRMSGFLIIGIIALITVLSYSAGSNASLSRNYDVARAVGFDAGIAESQQNLTDFLNQKQCYFSVGNKTGIRYNIRMFDFNYSTSGLTECEINRFFCEDINGLDCTYSNSTAECICNVVDVDA